MSAENKTCPFTSECGYIKYRANRPDIHIPPLPDNGSCGKNIEDCPRYKYASSNEESERVFVEKVINIHNPDPENIKTVLTIELPINEDEIKKSFPVIEENGEQKKRIVGGGFRS